MRRIWERSARAAALMIALLATIAIGHAQADPMRRGTITGVEPTDVIHGKVRPLKGTYFVGEPVVLRFTISNHARQELTVDTNFVPQSSLTIDISEPGEDKRPYTGPFPPGRYPNIAYKMLPFDEFQEDVMIWSDPGKSSGLAFDKPGDYIIEPSLTIEVGETGRIGKVPLEILQIKVVDTPPPLKPLIERLSQMKAYEKLQMRAVPPANATEIEQILGMYAPNPVTPYILYGLANYYAIMLRDHPERHDEAFNKALRYYQYAALSESALKMAIYGDLLRLLDRENKSKIATEMCRQSLKAAPSYMHGKMGGAIHLKKEPPKDMVYYSGLLKKYLINTPDPDRKEYWQLLN